MEKIFIVIGVLLLLGAAVFFIWDKTKSRVTTATPATGTPATPETPETATSEEDKIDRRGKYLVVSSGAKRFGVLDTETFTLKKVVEEDSGEVHYDVVTEFETPNFKYFVEGGQLKRTKKAQKLNFTPGEWD